MANCGGNDAGREIVRAAREYFPPRQNLVPSDIESAPDTTSEQLHHELVSIRDILIAHSKVETAKLPVRFIGVGAYSLDVGRVAHMTTSDSEEFLAVEQELLLQMLQAVEDAGTALAVPLGPQYA